MNATSTTIPLTNSHVKVRRYFLAAYVELNLALYQLARFPVQLDNTGMAWSRVNGLEKLLDGIGTALSLALDLCARISQLGGLRYPSSNLPSHYQYSYTIP